MMDEGHRKITVNASLLSGAVMLAFAGVAFWGAQGGNQAVWIFPRVAAGIAGVSGVMLIGIGLWKGDRVIVWETSRAALEVVLYALALVLYVISLAPIGMWCATALLVGGTAHVFGGGAGRLRLVKWVAVGLLAGLALDALFVGAFDVPLPGGYLWGGARWRWWVP